MGSAKSIWLSTTLFKISSCLAVMSVTDKLMMPDYIRWELAVKLFEC